MRSILEEFAYGNIHPNERFYNKDSELGKARILASRIEENLRERLNTEEVDILGTLIDAQVEVSRLTEMKDFLYGYRLGVIMTAEAFVTGGDLIAGA